MMENIFSSKPTVRTNTITESIPKTRARCLERLFKESSTAKKTNWNIKSNNSDIINVQNLFKNRSTNSERYEKYKRNISLEDRIIINVCGDRYETHRTTLELYPNTLLGNAKRRKYYYDKIRNEYFFDRNRACFESILYYYQSNGRIRRPNYISIDIFLEEVTFFQLGNEALNQIRKDENIKEFKKIPLPKNPIRRYLWATIEYPDYSKMAKFVNILSLIMIFISTMALAIESLPQYASLNDLTCEKDVSTTPARSETNNQTNLSSSNNDYTCYLNVTSPFFIIQLICVAYFTIEFFIRILSTPSIISFIKNIMNWIDLLAVIPFYISIGIYLTDRKNQVNSSTYAALKLLRILRFIRIFKFYRAFRSVKSLRVLGTTIKESLPDFIIMILILTLLGFLFGAATYFAENGSNTEMYDSIFKATYWGIITITSVGYGDLSPITPIGRILACLCALFGAATIGMLVSVLVDRYQRVYTRKLFLNDEELDFDDHSDDENNDTDSNDFNLSKGHGRNSKIADPDARAKENSIIENDSTELSQTFELQHEEEEEEENSIRQQNNRIDFIIGFVDNERQETSRDLLEKINSIISEKQNSGDNISFDIISTNEQHQQSSPFIVKF